MDFEKIQQLIQMFESSNTRELKIDDNNFHIYLTKNISKEPTHDIKFESNKTQQVSEVKENRKTITAPLVGTVYLASSPTSKPYVQVGSHIDKGDTVCVIEAMKLMTEIKSEVTGTIEKVNVENGELVEVGQPLFSVSGEKES
ncbi:acetyl-CoA carboxylase, biotin carboxyl carrier protein (plasmid) [Limosilactobacillus reuteri]|uniref:Biotin carboxyl carrier protein of acetyl-CoA carboxylase n=1 Tax=Limosilactobacillus reuteri TaxID=1598 RepID=A0A3M6SGJ5_LIMRT|nr:biotin/lipoyl-containing protein [Limosilactobacillus reuteri]MRG90122.1 acetyl-CoA carboxylase, biotin carboxyl carrier protein [Limosilactobacillus reuteri]RMX26569.1 acetyl-CoA carboxylase, biotin carboxyl carrier protein [Limosilactobacillus reuteri]